MTRSIPANISEARLGAGASCACALALVAVGFWFGAQGAVALEAAPSETQVKAAFILNFPKYVEWPAESFPTTNSSIVLGIVGESDIEGSLRKMIAGRLVNGRSVVVKHINLIEDGIDGCHMVFISSAERRRIPEVIEKLKGKSVLTIGETDDFLEGGGVINLARRDRKIALEVNLKAADKARLKMSAGLLSVAQVVQGRHI